MNEKRHFRCELFAVLTPDSVKYGKWADAVNGEQSTFTFEMFIAIFFISESKFTETNWWSDPVGVFNFWYY